MIELLAIPAWGTPPKTLTDWLAEFHQQGQPAKIAREGPDEIWIEVAPSRLRGLAVVEGDHVTAINFELHEPDSDPAARLVEAAASALGWEVHPEDPEGDVEED